MAKTVLKASHVASILSLAAKATGTDSLSKAIVALNANPKQDVAVIFTDLFGNADVKPA
jgi:hypothetical protein